MPRTFLPAHKGIALPETFSPRFLAGADALISDLCRNMEVPEANSEGRTPSPFAGVWQFQRALRGDAGRQERARAIAAFRGIISLFALREYYHVRVEADVSPRLKANRGKPTLVSTLFEVHTECLPQSSHNTQARFLFGERLVLFRVSEPAGRPSTVFAGYSPLTLFFPAARELTSSQALSAVFWYDRNSKRWRDPTVLSDDEQRRLPQEARSMLSAWLDSILTPAAVGDGLAILDDAGLAPVDDQLIASLLRNWRTELSEDTAGVTVRDSPLRKSAYLQETERSEGQRWEIPNLFGRVSEGPIPSDFPFNAETLIITLAEASNPTRRIYGNLFGSEQFRAALEAAAVEGPDLGVALGRAGQAPVPYVVLDRLFCTELGRIQQGQNTVSRGWFALQSHDARLGGIFLVPFTSTILRFFSPSDIEANTTIDDNVGALRVSFKHPDSGLEIQKSYSPQSIKTLDPSLDLRFFPNFRLDSLFDVDRQLPSETDRNYYARLRLSPGLDKLKSAWVGRNGTPLTDAVLHNEGTFDRPADRRFLALGKQSFWKLSRGNTPTAFEVERFGMILLELDELPREDALTPWSVGLDFGTTNSCVAIAGTNPSILKLPVLTTTFLTKWETGLRGESDEGFSALADFFFWQNEATQVLNENEFFPTQVLTRLSLQLEKLPDPGGFDERNGLAFFPNVSLAAVENKGFTDLIEGFEALRDPKSSVKPRFDLNRDLKWKDEDDEGGKSIPLRRVFHQHLRLHLILAAARDNAYIDKLVASYPKAFLPIEKSGYEDELKEIWGPSTQVETRSESAAAAVTLEVAEGQEFFMLDMGGGTTDVAVFKDGILEEECSLAVAGGILEKYVCQSSSLREQIIRCFVGVSEELAEAFTADNQTDQVYRTLFQGFLVQNGGAQKLANLMRLKPPGRATQGFLLSLIILYAGLSYFCGRWLAARRGAKTGIPADEHLQWLGNGSSFIQTLNVGRSNFEEVLGQVFNKASQASVHVSPLRSDAKTVVAKGLLKTSMNDRAKVEQRVFSNLLSNSLSLDGNRIADDETLSHFYQHFSRSRDTLEWDGLSSDTIFRGFLDALQTCLPATHFNKSALVKVETLGIREPHNWAVEYVTSNRETIARTLRRRIIYNENRWESVIQRGEPSALYVEPVFISEVVALLDQIRTNSA